MSAVSRTPPELGPRSRLEGAAPAVGARAWFGAFTLLGAAWAFSLVSILSIGMVILPLATVATVVLLTRRSSRQGLPGLVAGLGAPLVYVAYRNRAGPGQVCTELAARSSCTQDLDPLPWLIVGLCLVAVGAVAFLIRSRPHRRLPGEAFQGGPVRELGAGDR